jgi:hypothetical protein
MVKSNVAVTTMLSWDKYRGLKFDETLASIYTHAAAASKTFCTWYWTSIKLKRHWSLSVRGITFLLLLIGTCSPLLAGVEELPKNRLILTQLGVIALAAAGLLQVADRVFGWSSGWLRYITTVTAMESLTRKFELEWGQYIVARNGALGEADTKLLFDLAARFEADLVKMQSEETEKWVSEFNSGTAVLGENIKSQREAGEKAVEAAHAVIASKLAAAELTANQRGAIELTLTFGTGLKPVLISVDGVQAGGEFFGTGWSSRDLTPGQHQITVKTISSPPQEASKIATVLAGGVCPLAITLP